MSWSILRRRRRPAAAPNHTDEPRDGRERDDIQPAQTINSNDASSSPWAALDSLLKDRYRIDQEIARERSSQVFRATDVSTGKAVSIVVRDIDDTLEANSRFQEMTAIMAMLDHPGIVKMYAATQVERRGCVVMECPEGQSLDRILAEGPLPLSKIRAIMCQVASTLAYVHSRGIVHRDIKPGHIVVQEDDRVKITGFGIARTMPTGYALNAILGTPRYMAPEQLGGSQTDGRTDIFAVGTILFDMLIPLPIDDSLEVQTGTFKVERGLGDEPSLLSVETNTYVRRAAPRSPNDMVRSAVPVGWQSLIKRCLAQDPADRFPSATALEEALAVLVDEGDETDRIFRLGLLQEIAAWQKKGSDQSTFYTHCAAQGAWIPQNTLEESDHIVAEVARLERAIAAASTVGHEIDMRLRVQSTIALETRIAGLEDLVGHLPEAMHLAQQALTAPIHRHGGELARWSSYNVTAYFGLYAPGPFRVQEAERAVHAALEMQSELRAILRQVDSVDGSEVHLCSGIAVAHVLVSDDSHLDDTYGLGSAAEYVVRKAACDEVLVTETIYEKTKDTFHFECRPDDLYLPNHYHLCGPVLEPRSFGP